MRMGGVSGQNATRREVLSLGAAVAGIAISFVSGTWVYRSRHSKTPLHAETVAYATEEQRVLVTDSAQLEPGTRVAAGPTSDGPRRREDDFLKVAQPWLDRVPTEHHDLARSSLLDLWVLSDGLPATVAGWSPRWRYVWPRDASFCAVALARVGHVDSAVAQLRYLQRVQHRDGWFDARYDPLTDRAPDARPRQFDGTGLAAWAVAEVIESTGRQGITIGDRLDPLVRLTYTALVRATNGGRALPAPSPDFWEVRERLCTIGLAACTLSGLVAAGRVLGTASAAERFQDVVAQTYAATGFTRYGTVGGPDAGAAFLAATGVRGLCDANQLRALGDSARRPGGGIAPGASWKDDGISWTPATSLLALASARSGDAKSAHRWLTWLDEHRTKSGSIPEKVLHDGSPAAEAPLAWSCANVILALDTLIA